MFVYYRLLLYVFSPFWTAFGIHMISEHQTFMCVLYFFVGAETFILGLYEKKKYLRMQKFSSSAEAEEENEEVSEDIPRYAKVNGWVDTKMLKSPDGGWVKWEDHIARVQELQDKIEELQEASEEHHSN